LPNEQMQSSQIGDKTNLTLILVNIDYALE